MTPNVRGNPAKPAPAMLLRCPIAVNHQGNAYSTEKSPSNCLQHVLYRSAKQQPTRRFRALFDKIARSDVLERAWDDVGANRGAPGVDGVTIAQAEALGGGLPRRARRGSVRRDMSAGAAAAGAHPQSQASRARPGRLASPPCRTA
jgi:hypothetical protein